MKTLIIIFIITVSSINAQHFFNVTNPFSGNLRINNNEPSIAINPTDNNNIIVGTNFRPRVGVTCEAGAEVSACYYSSDLGNTWNFTTLDRFGLDIGADPNVAFNSDGTAYFSYLLSNYSTVFCPTFDSKIVLAKSDNGGATWSNYFILAEADKEIDQIEYDKPSLALDISNDFAYVTYVEFEINGCDVDYTRKIGFNRLQGTSISEKTIINYFENKMYVSNPIPVVDRDGKIYVSYYSEDTDGNKSIKILKSTDFGQSFEGFQNSTNEITISEIESLNPTTAGFNFRINSFQSTAVDLSEGNYSNSIYCVWSEYLGESNPQNTTDVYFCKSTNGGESWTQKIPFNSTSLIGEQFFPVIDVDSRGKISLLFYSIENKYEFPNSKKLSIRLFSSIDGGLTFWEEQYFIDNDFSFLYNDECYVQDFIGDYIDIATTDDYIIPVWTVQDNTSRICNNKNPETIRATIINNQFTINTFSKVNLNNEGYFFINDEAFYNGDNKITYAGINHSVTASEYLDNNPLKKFRNFEGINNPFKRLNNFEFINGFHNSEVSITSRNFSTEPLIVSNNLEGGTGGNYNLTWTNSSQPEFAFPYGTAYNAFKNQDPTFDRYKIEAPALTNVLGTSWNFSHWNDGTTNSIKPSVPIDGPTTFTANYKGHFRSNNNTASSSNGQRKLMRDQYGIYHLVYTSMNRLWYTKSLTTDYGGSWSQEIDLNGDYDPDYEIRNPSFDIMGDFIALVCELKQANNYYVFLFQWNVNVIPSNPPPATTQIATIDANYFGQAYPVVAYTYRPINNSKEIFTVYRTGSSGALKYSRRHYVNGALTESEDGINVPGSSFQSKFPSIAGSKSTHKVFITYSDEQRYIRHIESDHDYIFGGRDFNAVETISSGSGYKYNHSPSISLFSDPGLNFRPIVSWTVTDNAVAKQTGDQTTSNSKICIRPNSNSIWGSFLLVGDAVTISQNASTNTVYGESVVAWSQNNGTQNRWVKRINGSYNTTKCIPQSGKGLLLSNGTGLTNIKALVFNDNSLPYTLTKSAENFNLDIECEPGGGEIGKITVDGSITFGRSGLILKKGVEFLFNIGDVIVNDSIISFIEKSDTNKYDSSEELNSVIKTNSFELDTDAEFIFSNMYFVNNSEFADTSLTSEDAVIFKAELVNATTGNIAGTFDEITFTKNNLNEYENIAYQVNCSGIQPGEYYLRLVTNVVGEAEYNLANVQNDASILEKKSFHTVYFDGSQFPKEYDMSQNYPNPFNPATVINYQIPKDGLVTIKVYDILGKEVTTLVNGNKSVGRYSINFDGSNLASGVYIYQLKAGDFVSSKKMMLIK